MDKKLYYGELEILEQEVEQKENGRYANLTLTDGKTVSIPNKTVPFAVTETPSSMSDVRNRLTKEIVKEMLDVLVSYETKLIDLMFTFSALENVIDAMREESDSKLYGKSVKYDLSIFDLKKTIGG